VSKETETMKWLLDQIYGPDALGDPYYELFVDAWALIPWWYPTMIIVIASVLLLNRWIERARYRRRTVRAAIRVRARTGTYRRAF
jgi:hypothetical protein